MIQKIEFISERKTKKSVTVKRFGYIEDVPTVFGKTFEFTPGLNIIVGKNGSGKSTVLSSCAFSLAALQGGVSTVTDTWRSDLFDYGEECIKLPWNVAHDGQPAIFVDPRMAFGLIGGSFDDDFFNAGLRNTMNRASTGEKTMGRIDQVIGIILGKGSMPQSFDWKIRRDYENETWRQKIEHIDNFLAPTIDKGPQTILMDEPESYLSLPVQVTFWKKLMAGDPDRFKNLQVVIATHSPFAFGIKHANYIEMEPEYLRECKAALAYANQCEQAAALNPPE